MKQLTKIWGDLLYPTEFIYSNSRQLIQLKIYRTGTYWNNSSDGKLLTRTWARLNAGQPLTTTYGYDIFGQLQKIDYSDSTPDITYTYNRLGLPLTVTDAAGTRTFTYNAQFALQKESISGIYTKELNRVYTTSGLKGSYSGLNIGTVNLYTYGYDQYNRLNQVTTAAGVFNYTFLANSDLIASMTRPNNASTNYTYETARDLLTKVANGSISTFQYNNDALGRRTSMNRSSSAITAADVLSYTYNSYSELAGASSNNNASYRYSYTYDPIGNRKTAGLAGTNWTYTANNLNQYTALNQAGTVQNPTYDADGNMLTRDGWTQTWNAENRLIKAEKGTAKLEFAYDYMGRRIEKKVYNGNTLTGHIRFVYDGYKLIEELNGMNNNTVLRRYVWQPVMLDSPLTVFDAVANKTYFYHADANKNVTDLTDSAGAIVAHYEYSPFGQLVKSSGAYANTNVLTWSSEYTDRETGLIYYNFREYDPKLGRWLSRDILEEFISINLFSYANNSPISFYDNWGLAISSLDGSVEAAIRAGDIELAQSLLQELIAQQIYDQTALLAMATAIAQAQVISESQQNCSNSTEPPQCEKLREQLKKLRKDQAGARKNIEEHEQKLKDYLENPFRYDNQGILRHLSEIGRQDLVEKAIKGRANFLWKTIKKHSNNLEKFQKQILDIIDKMRDLGCDM